MTKQRYFENIRDLLTQLHQQTFEPQKKLIDEINLIVNLLENEWQSSSTEMNAASHSPQIDKQSGCYRFADDPAYYCPKCFDHDQFRQATQRINSKLRICSRCRTSLKPTA